MKSNLLIYSFSAIAIICIDQITKQYAYALEYAQEITLWLLFSKALNRGVSWGMFNGTNQTVFGIVTLITIAITIAVALYGYQQYKEGNRIWGQVLVCAGSFSNIIDRFLYGGVIDFIHLHYAGYSWPLFNVADVCIVGGVAILFLSIYESK